MAIEYGSGTLEVTMEGPFGNGSNAARLVCFTAPAANWKGGESPWSQVVEVSAVSASSKVDLQLGPEQLQQLHECNMAFTAENDGGTVTLWAIGDKPSEDLTFQAILTEVVA